MAIIQNAPKEDKYSIPPVDTLGAMAKEPKLGETEKVQEDNEKYKQETRENLSGELAKLNDELYGIPTSKEQNSTDSLDVSGSSTNQAEGQEQKDKNEVAEKGNEKKDEQKIDEQFKDSPNYITLTRLQKFVPEEAYNKALEEFKNAKTEEDGKAVVEKLAENIPNSEAKEKYKNLLDGKKQEVNENNFKDTEFAKDAQELKIDLDNGVGGLEIMLAENYISAPIEAEEGENNANNKADDIKATMDMSVNLIMKDNTPEFKQNNAELIGKIRETGNLEEKYKLLKDLYKEDLKEDAKLKGKKVKEEYGLKQNSLQAKAKELSEQYKQAQSIANEAERAKELAKIQAEAQKIAKEGKETEEFVAQVKQLSGGKLDIASSGVEKEVQK